MRRETGGRPAGFLIVGATGAGGGGVSSGWVFFLGTTMGPESEPGPPESVVELSGCCGLGVGAGGVDWARRLGVRVAAPPQSKNASKAADIRE